VAVEGRLARLSLAALGLAAQGLRADAPAVAQWLYRFGTLPRGPAIDRDFGPDDDPMAVLGMTVGGTARRLLESSYEASTIAGWYSFARPGDTQVQAVCKLYVSPRPEALADHFPTIAAAFVRHEVRSFKIGRGIEGLLRPDKIIAYFDDAAHLDDVAGSLGQLLRDCPPHGAPFTADVGLDGLLSMGVDPPVGDVPVSWRSWVTKRLAASLAAPGPASGDGVTMALEDLRLAGVDPDRWLPTGDLADGGSR
jgi:hypothetical protein